MSLEIICKSTEKLNFFRTQTKTIESLCTTLHIYFIYALPARIQLLASVIEIQILKSKSQLQKNASAPKSFSTVPLTAACVAGLSDTLLAAELNICSRRP